MSAFINKEMGNKKSFEVVDWQFGRQMITLHEIEAGETIGFAYGTIASEPTMYTVQLNSKEHVDFCGSGVECANHSCDPNCRLIVGNDSNGGFVALIALKAIKAREAATFDYETTEWDMVCPFKCSCGCVGKCKGEIRGYKYLDMEKRQKIHDLASPFIQSMILTTDEVKQESVQYNRESSIELSSDVSLGFYLGDWMHGQHIISTRDFEAGQVVYQVKGLVSTQVGMHTIQISATEHADFRGSGVEFTSHSCDPNCRLVVGTCVENGLKVGCVSLIAIKFIKTGDAPSYDYESTEWELKYPFQCSCGASCCKKTIRGSRFLSVEDQKNIYDISSDFLRRMVSSGST